MSGGILRMVKINDLGVDQKWAFTGNKPGKDHPRSMCTQILKQLSRADCPLCDSGVALFIITRYQFSNEKGDIISLDDAYLNTWKEPLRPQFYQTVRWLSTFLMRLPLALGNPSVYE